MIKRPPFRYLGSKFRIAQWIIDHMPTHGCYCEPFGGSGAVLLQKPVVMVEVFNDLDDEVVNVFEVLRDGALAEQLRDAIELTPFSRTELMRTQGEPPTDKVEWARQTIARSFMGFGADAVTRGVVTGFRIRRFFEGRRSPAQSWADWPQQIRLYTERLRGVIIENKDALEIMSTFDHPDCVHYVDPPYVRDTRGKRFHGYRHEMSDADHIVLLHRLAELDGMVMLSGYDHAIYNDMLQGWEKLTLETHADRAIKRTEVLWINPHAWSRRRKQETLF